MKPSDRAAVRIVDLFAGIGGLRLPFDEEYQVDCVLTSEKDKFARETYAANFGVEIDEIDQDVSKYTPENAQEVPDHDLLLAGFPCQPFSSAGLRAGFSDTRGTLFFSVAAIAQAKKPKVLVLENVRGLVTHDSGRTYRVILNTLHELGYVAHTKILNARDFGLPQNRNRLFIVALRADLPSASTYIFPEPTHDRNNLRVGDILEPETPDKFTISDRLWQGHQARKLRNKVNGKGFGYQLFTRDSKYTATISARYYKDGSEILIKQGSLNPRKITPREAARLQGFPESFQINSSDVQAYKQFGNAVPVSVVRAIAKSLRPHF